MTTTSVNIPADPAPVEDPAGQPTVDENGNLVTPAATPEADPERPAWLPENFKTPEDLATSYKEAQAELTRLRQGQPKPEEKPEEKPEAKPEAKPEEKPEEKPEAKPEEKPKLDPETFNLKDSIQEMLNAGGEFDDSDYEILKEAGYSRDAVDLAVQGVSSQLDAVRNSAYEAVGGEEQYDVMVEWAAQSLSASEVTAFNNVVDSGDPASVKMAAEGLAAKYRDANGTAPARQINGGNAGGKEGYQSWAQVTADMSDARYETDPAYRKSVADKLDISNNLR